MDRPRNRALKRNPASVGWEERERQKRKGREKERLVENQTRKKK